MNFQILRSTPATLELQVFLSGDLTDLDANPTLVLTDGNGDVVASGAVSKPGAPNAVGVYRSVMAAQADLKVINAVWSGLLATQPVTFYQTYEVVGNLLFTEADARAEPIVGQQAALSDDVKYSDTRIAHWRAVIGEMFEDRLRRGVVRRYCRVETAGNGGPLDMTYGYPMLANGSPLIRPGRSWDITRIISATVNGDVQDPADIQIVGYKLFHTTGSWSGSSNTTPLNVVVEYEYGPDPVEAEVHQRALDLLLANAAPKGFPSTATSISTEDGTFRITTFPVGVEEMLKQRKHRAGFGIA